MSKVAVVSLFSMLSERVSCETLASNICACTDD